MAVQYARIETKSAFLAGDFGRDYACRIFDVTEEQLAEKVGRFSRGSRAGKLRGAIEWKKCTVGGWSHERGGVIKPNTTMDHVIIGADGEIAIHGKHELKTRAIVSLEDRLKANEANLHLIKARLERMDLRTLRRLDDRLKTKGTSSTWVKGRQRFETQLALSLIVAPWRKIINDLTSIEMKKLKEATPDENEFLDLVMEIFAAE